MPANAYRCWKQSNHSASLSPPTSNFLHRHSYVRANEGHIPHEPSNRQQEITKQHRNAVAFDYKPDERPSEQDE